MNMLNRKPSRLAPADDNTDVIAALHRRIVEMQDDDKADLERQIALEGTAGPAGAEGNAANLAQAEEFLSGAEFTMRDKPASLLATLVARRQVRALALKIAGSRHTQLAAERAAQIWQSHFAEIAEMEKRRVLLAIELQRTNRAREQLREKITKAGGTGFLSSDGVDLLGFGDAHDEIQWAANRLVADGIATVAEIEKARSDG
jgi:hypothetical protein